MPIYKNVGGVAPQYMGPDAAAAQKRLGQMLVEGGMSEQPMRHWTQALGSVLQTGVGALNQDMALRDVKEGQAAGNKALAQMLMGGDGSAAMANPYSADKALGYREKMADRGYAEGKEKRDLESKKALASEAGLAPGTPGFMEYVYGLKQPSTEYRSLGDALIAIPPGGTPREVYTVPPKPDPVKDMLLERMRRGRGGPPAASPPGPGFAPMSFGGGSPSPGVTLIDAPAPMPEAAPAPDMEPNTIDTPYGPMSREEAQQMGGAMLLDPKYAAAGKALLDSLNAGKGELSKPATTQLEEGTISAAKTLGRLGDIKRQFKPEFQQIPTKLKLMGASWGAAVGAPLSPEIQKNLGDFSRFKATAFDNFNQLLKELSGTAVTAQELTRQKIVQPNPGEGLLDGDDPVTFMSKIENAERVAKAAIARMNFMRNRGLDFNKDTAERFLRLEDVPAAIDRRGAEVEAELKRTMPGADPMSIEREAEKIVRREFGI